MAGGVDGLPVDGVGDVDAAVDKHDGTVGGFGAEVGLDAFELGCQGGVVDDGDDLGLLAVTDEPLEAEEGVEWFGADLGDRVSEVHAQARGGGDELGAAFPGGDRHRLVDGVAEFAFERRLRLGGAQAADLHAADGRAAGHVALGQGVVDAVDDSEEREQSHDRPEGDPESLTALVLAV